MLGFLELSAYGAAESEFLSYVQRRPGSKRGRDLAPVLWSL